LLEPNQEVKVSRKIRTFKPSPDLAEPRVCEGDSAGKEIFDNGSFTFGKDIRAHSITNLGKGLYALSSYSSNAECALKKAKNLDATLQQQVAGESQDVKGKVLQFMVKLKNDGNQETTIQGYAKVLRQLIRKGASLNDGENVKEVLANQKWAESTKQYASIVYDKFAEYSGIQWERPKYRPDRKLPFIPLESEIDSLIAHCGKKLATLLRLLKESGLRVGEAIRLEWKDLDIKNSTITLNKPEKHGTCRMFKVSTELLAMLNSLPKNSNRIFGPRVLSSYEGDFSLQRKRAVNKLQNPRLLQIHFHTFRHWKATIEYAKTKDLLHVMKLLGHRSVQNTLIYTQLISFESNEYHSATAKTIREAAQLVEAGFEFVCAVDNIQLFRKRK
jgi:integrase